MALDYQSRDERARLTGTRARATLPFFYRAVICK
jgi:hypothetical protein